MTLAPITTMLFQTLVLHAKYVQFHYLETSETSLTIYLKYWFEVSNTTAAPDGFERNALLINGSFPGPVIFADWGDTVGRYHELLIT